MPTWQEIRDAKKAAKQAAYARYGVDIGDSVPASRKNVLGVPAECGKLSKQELEITEKKATDLLADLASGKLSAVEVTTAFGKRALIADQVVNCLTEVFLDAALEQAAQLDAYFKANGKPCGPLHGLPISLKDQFSIKGIDTCMGYSAWANKPAERDSALVAALKRAGAVLYVRTNIPQSLMLGETINPVYGLTTNPHNRELTCGGSSGGEGALIAMKGSPLGVGTDMYVITEPSEVSSSYPQIELTLSNLSAFAKRRLHPHPRRVQRPLRPQTFLQPPPLRPRRQLSARRRIRGLRLRPNLTGFRSVRGVRESGVGTGTVGV